MTPTNIKGKTKWILKTSMGAGTKAGMIFTWDVSERAYTTKEMPWFLTPMFTFFEVKKYCHKL